jgi:hypothetical protein
MQLMPAVPKSVASAMPMWLFVANSGWQLPLKQVGLVRSGAMVGTANMGIWQFNASDRVVKHPVIDSLKRALDADGKANKVENIYDDYVDNTLSKLDCRCEYCKGSLLFFKERVNDLPPIPAFYMQLWYDEIAIVCAVCGWWISLKFGDLLPSPIDYHLRTLNVCRSTLIDLDLTDISIPVDDVKTYLSLKYERRFSVSPRLFEEAVASVFRDAGYYAEITKYSHDGGIDVILRGEAGDQIGVQVKRYRNKIVVSQIREFIGALVVAGYTQGIFLTTSSFTADAVKSVERAKSRGLYIDLIGDNSFLTMLNLRSTDSYQSFSDWSGRHDDRRFSRVGKVRFYNYAM